MASAERRIWTTRGLLDWTSKRFEQEGFDHARLRSEMLQGHVLEVERLKLYMDPDRPTSDLERAAYRELVERALKHEPVDYLVGRTPFFNMMLKVTPAVLIPRPSTETLVEHVIQHARRTPGFHQAVIADIGTGSGAIAITLAKHVPGSRVIATDKYADALAVAKENATAQKVADRIDFREGHLLDALDGARVRYLVSNPPYIPDDEWESVEDNVKKYEPTHALRGGSDGLDMLREIVEGASALLERPGQLVLEGPTAGMKELAGLAKGAGFKNVQVLADHEGLDRVLVGEV